MSSSTASTAARADEIDTSSRSESRWNASSASKERSIPDGIETRKRGGKDCVWEATTEIKGGRAIQQMAWVPWENSTIKAEVQKTNASEQKTGQGEE